MEKDIKRGEALARAIIDHLDRLDISTAHAANVLSRAPGVIQHKVWKLIRAIIATWAVDARYQQYDPQYTHIYRWAEKHDFD